MVAAHKWFNLAAVRGVEAAKSWRNQMAAEMNTGQIAQAQKLAREWLTYLQVTDLFVAAEHRHRPARSGAYRSLRICSGTSLPASRAR